MTKLPEKDLLAGTKTPATTTGEMKTALGKLRDYLFELFGEDSSDKKTAREGLGIRLSDFASQTDIKTMQAALEKKADKSELQEKADREKLTELESELAKKGAPIGSIDYFAMAIPPAGYLKANGAAVGREAYPELFAAIGTVYGEGDGETTFNLPDLIGRFTQGSDTPGEKIESGLPNIEGYIQTTTHSLNIGAGNCTGAFTVPNRKSGGSVGGSSGNFAGDIGFDASQSSPVYGASDIVQPPALTLLPCIKAFSAATGTGLIDMTGLANDVSVLSANKLDKAVDGVSLKYVTETFDDGTNWYRKWSDGWIEQGGVVGNVKTITLNLPMATNNYYVQLQKFFAGGDTSIVQAGSLTPTAIHAERTWGSGGISVDLNKAIWFACGRGA